MPKSKLLFFSFLCLLPTIIYGADDDLARARTLIKAGDYNAAYVLLEPLEFQYSGDVNYDYLFGLSAVESGNVTRGMFALERVLAIEPNNPDARTEMAIAHLKVGETEAARSEFENLLSLNPPETAKNTINRLMSAIDKATGVANTFTAYLEGTLGHDSNVSSATGATSVALPIFGGNIFNLDRAFREREDGFTTAAGGVGFTLPINKNVALIGNLNASNKFNWKQDDFNLGYLDYSIGAKYKKFEHAFTLLAQDGRTYVGEDAFRRAYGLTAQWQYDVNQSNQLSAYIQQTRLAYYQNQSIRDADRFVGGLSYAHVFSGDLTPVVYISVYAGNEDERESNVPFLGHDLYGIRVGTQMTLKPNLVMYANAAYEKREYGGDDPIFLTQREDRQHDFSIGARYFPNKSWVIKPQISYIDTESNIVINEFDRLLASISIRRDFNW